jgi:hypothetical protein
MRNGLTSTRTLSVQDTPKTLQGNVISTSASVSSSGPVRDSKRDEESNQLVPLLPSSSAYVSKPTFRPGSTSVVDGQNKLAHERDSHIIGLPAVPVSSSILTSSKGYTSSNVSSVVPLNSSTHTVNSQFEDSIRGATNYVEQSPGNDQHGIRFGGIPDAAEMASREAFGTSSSSDLARKNPPPYHVAARRAAFFRSSGGAGGAKLSGSGESKDIQQQQPLINKMSPLVGVRMFPSLAPSTDSTMGYPPVPMFASASSSGRNSPSPYVTNLGSNFTRNDSPRMSLNEGRAEEQKKEMLVTGNSKERHDDTGNEDDGINSSPESKFDRTYVISKDLEDSTSDLVGSSLDENLDEVDGGGGSAIDDQTVSNGNVDGLRSKNLVETIETALEKVDKRTTEFLRNDKWEPEEDERSVAGPVLETSVESREKFGSRVKENTMKINEPLASGLEPRSIKVPSGIVPPSFSLKGPVPPPKPSPHMSRNRNTGVNFAASDFTENPYGGSSKTDSYTKIPFLSTSSATSLVKPINTDLAASNSVPVSVQASRILPVSSAIHTTNSAHRGYEIATSGPVSPASTGLGSSRIPSKLPFLASGPSSIGSLASVPSSLHSDDHPIPAGLQSKKPDIVGPKPSIARAVTPSRIPSFGSGDSSVPKDTISSNITGGVKVQPKSNLPSLSSSTNINTSSSRAVNSSSGLSFSSSSSAISSSSVSSAAANTKIPRFGEPLPEKQDLKRSTSGTKIPKFNDSTNSSIKSVSPVPPSGPSSSGSISLDNAGVLAENNNDSLSSPTNIPISGGDGSLNTNATSSKIPSFSNRKPWIFGSHKNARVVS